MSVLVTGCAGFIGFHLTKRLIEDKVDVIGLDNINDYYDTSLKKARLNELIKLASKNNNDFKFFKISLEDKKDLTLLFNEFKIQRVVNLAAQAGVRYSLENPMAYVESNIVGFLNILEECKKNEVKNLLYASSSSVYGGNTNAPFNEKQAVNHPISMYAVTKKSNELMAHSYSHLYGLPAIGLRFFTVYGPWGRPDMALFLFTKSILKGKPIKVFNNGDMVRDFTYVEDIVESLIRLLDKPAAPDIEFDGMNPRQDTSWAPHRIFNIGNSKPIELMSYIKSLEKALNKKAELEFLPMQPGDVPLTSSDNSSLENFINFKPNTSIDKGINSFVEWYLNFYEKI